MHVQMRRHAGGRHLIKRAMDIAFSLTALLVLMPLLLALAFIVRADSSGPALFRQERMGLNGVAFNMIKFRSMNHAGEGLPTCHGRNEATGKVPAMTNRGRVTRCGRWMRKFSLDELPQFLNVLKGDMSLVGPRPPLKTEDDKFGRPACRRLLARPGLTGLWQFNGRSELPWEEAAGLERHYIENWSLTGDMIILWRTLKSVYEPSGAY